MWLAEKARKVYATIFWIVVWAAVAELANRSLLIPIPTPLSTVKALARYTCSDLFWKAAAMSLVRICAGFIAALFLGAICAFVGQRHRTFKILMAPIVHFIRSVPGAALTIVLFLWIKRDGIPSAVSFFTVFPMIWINLENALEGLDGSLVEMAKVHGLSRRRITAEIIIPGVRPAFLSSIAGGLGFAWKSGVAAEVICRSANSFGNLLWAGKNAIEYDEVFALVIVIVVFSSILQKIAMLLVKAGGRND